MNLFFSVSFCTHVHIVWSFRAIWMVPQRMLHHIIPFQMKEEAFLVLLLLFGGQCNIFASKNCSFHVVMDQWTSIQTKWSKFFLLRFSVEAKTIFRFALQNERGGWPSNESIDWTISFLLAATKLKGMYTSSKIGYNDDNSTISKWQFLFVFVDNFQGNVLLIIGFQTRHFLMRNDKKLFPFQM